VTAVKRWLGVRLQLPASLFVLAVLAGCSLLAPSSPAPTGARNDSDAIWIGRVVGETGRMAVVIPPNSVVCLVTPATIGRSIRIESLTMACELYGLDTRSGGFPEGGTILVGHTRGNDSELPPADGPAAEQTT
jgi:hypothetical protein